MVTQDVTLEELHDAWPVLSRTERLEAFEILRKDHPDAAEELFLEADASMQSEILLSLKPQERRTWIRMLPPDDTADVMQNLPERRDEYLALLDDATRHEVTALLAYAEDVAGGLMNPRYARLRPSASVDEALIYLKRQFREGISATQYVYVIDTEHKLVGVVSLRELFAAPPNKQVREVMRSDLVTCSEQTDQESLSRLFAHHDLIAIPVVDGDGRMKGVVTVDDIVDVVQEVATEDAQKFGGMEALEDSYMATPMSQMIKKRGGWLAALLLGEMLTASAMGYFEDEIARAVVLALFVPLIISSGGNSGSQASTLVIRAMALGEVRLRDWFKVVRREIVAGFALGLILAVLGFIRVIVWQALFKSYGEHSVKIAATVGVSLLGVVMFGTFAGSLLPFVLRKVGADPASASAPFVATLVDVTGLIIYFTAAGAILGSVLLN